MKWLRAWLYRHGVRWYAQNMNDRAPGVQGPMWQYGRAWLKISRGDGNTGAGYCEILEINPEWHLKPEPRAGVGVQLGGGDSDNDIQLNVDVGLARLYLTFESRWWKPLFDRILPGYWFESRRVEGEQWTRYDHFDKPGPGRLKVNHEVEVGIGWYSGCLWWSIWQTTMEWKSGTPRWRSGHFDPLDWALGRHVHKSTELGTETVLVPMPEHGYPAAVTLTLDEWKRPRWPFALRVRRANIEVEGGIPHPGKGENSWDCGDDATYSLTCRARTSEQAVARMVESVLSSRRRYGGMNWQPREAVA